MHPRKSKAKPHFALTTAKAQIWNEYQEEFGDTS